MTTELLLVLGLLGLVIVLFVRGRPRADVVGLIAICMLPLTGVLTIKETLAGFSDPNIVLIAALFIIGEGLVRTGVARHLGDWLVVQAGSSQTRLTVLLMTVACGLGSTMSSTAVTAIFIPVVMRICRRMGISPSQLMMPLSFAALVSGMTTLVATSPNLVINSELIRRGDAGFRFFSFTPFGVPLLGLCILYMLFARRWLPAGTDTLKHGRPERPSLADWVKRYDLVGREFRLLVANRSPLIGRTLEAINFRSSDGVTLVAIQRGRHLMQPTAKTVLQVGDVMFVDLFTSEADITDLREKYQLQELPLSGTHFIDHSQEIGMAEMFVPADSGLVGKTVVDGAIRSRFGFSVIGLRRGVQALNEGISDEKLKIGDTLLVIGPWKAIRNAQTVGGGDLMALNLPAEFDDVLPVTGRMWHAIGTLLAVVLLMVFGVLPNVHAALIGCLVLGVFGCIDLESAYRSIDWKTLILIVGMLPFSIALQRTGGVEMASNLLASITDGAGTYGVLGCLFLMTSLLGLFISNTATAVLMGPVALSVADRMGASPYPFAMIVALACSAAFMTPVSSPVNTLVVTPGNYRFGDFIRIGVPFTLVVLVYSVLTVPLLLPL